MRKLLLALLILPLFTLLVGVFASPVEAQNRSLEGPAGGIRGKRGAQQLLQEQQESVDEGEKGNTSLGSFVKGYNDGFLSDWVFRVVGYKQEIGVAESAGKAMAALYTPAANTETYIADLMNSAGFGIVQPAYAQGLGFSALNPILEAWKVFRNLAYFFYVIIFLIIGFMIMFRQKISAQAVVTAQQALPRIVVSLIAVTFSYAIAGLMIDTMYLVMFLIVGIFQPQFDTNLQELALSNNLFGVGLEIFKMGIFNTSGDAVKTLVETAVTGTLVEGLKGVLGWIGGLTFAVVFSLSLVFGIFRLFFELLKTYISIVIGIVMSPLALMMGALPGNNAFQAWFKSMVANLAVFPAILIIIIIAFILGGKTVGATNDLSQGGGFLPPYLIGQGNADAIRALLGMGILLVLPEIATQVKKSLGGGGGIFEQFGNNFISALGKGWKGGELIPGLGFTDTRKLPFGGLSGENLARKTAVGTYAAGGAVVGGASRVPSGSLLNVGFGMSQGFTGAGGRAALTLGDKELFKKTQERLKKKP